MKSREDRKKLKFFGARGEALRKGKGPYGRPKARGKPGGGKGRPKRDPTEMRRHAFCGARPQGAPEALAVR